MVRLTLASAVTAGALLVAPSAFAQTTAGTAGTAHASASYSGDTGAVEMPGWSVAGLLGFAFNDIGFGLGARGGYTLDNQIYLGGTLLYHFGSNDVSAFMIGGEGGYDFPVGPVIIRPYLGLGVSVVSVNVPSFTAGGVTVGGGSASSTNVALWPGCTVLYPIPGNERWVVGGDARILVINDFNTFALFGTGGIRF